MGKTPSPASAREWFERSKQKGDRVVKKQKMYQGWKDQRTHDVYITVDDASLRYVGRYSKTLEWGYSDSGQSDLALSLLTDYLGNEEQALRLHQHFKRTIVTGLDEWSWTLDGEQIENWLKHIIMQPDGSAERRSQV